MGQAEHAHRRDARRGQGPCRDAARDAAIAIVARLIGDTVSADDAAQAPNGAGNRRRRWNSFSDPEFWVAVGFVIVIGIFLYQRVPAFVAAALDARAAAIAKELDEAKRLREEAEALLADYKKKAGAVEQEAEAIMAEARAEAERFAAESREALKQQIERRAQLAQDKIAQAEAQAMAEIRTLAADAAAAAAEKLIAARLDETRASDLIAQSLKELAGKLN